MHSAPLHYLIGGAEIFLSR